MLRFNGVDFLLGEQRKPEFQKPFGGLDVAFEW